MLMLTQLVGEKSLSTEEQNEIDTYLSHKETSMMQPEIITIADQTTVRAQVGVPVIQLAAGESNSSNQPVIFEVGVGAVREGYTDEKKNTLQADPTFCCPRDKVLIPAPDFVSYPEYSTMWTDHISLKDEEDTAKEENDECQIFIQQPVMSTIAFLPKSATLLTTSTSFSVTLMYPIGDISQIFLHLSAFLRPPRKPPDKHIYFNHLNLEDKVH